jgi:hypothetical protein
MSDNRFVDLYSILDVPPDATTDVIRRQIARLYIEAQDNLEHRNFRKRFYYSEMYEVHLPNAHHSLLNEERRAAYDLALKSHLAAGGSSHTDSPRAASDAQPAAFDATLLPSLLGEEQKDDYHEQLANDLDLPQAARKPRPPTPEWARMDKQRVEMRRDLNRRELIKHELRVGSLRAALGTSFVLFTFSLLAIHFSRGALGFNRDTAIMVFIFSMVLNLLLTHWVWKNTRRKTVATLSKMPYEELLRRYSD